MYLTKIIMENVGPLNSINIEPLVTYNIPEPIILVGENGSGKSIILSHIVDSLFEFSKKTYRDITPSINALHNPYYKVTGSITQKINTPYGFCFLEYTNNENSNKYQYIDESGSLELNECKAKTNNLMENFPGWKNFGNNKFVSNKIDDYEKIFAQNSICYFPPYRYEVPHWLNIKSITPDDNLHSNIKIKGMLNKPLVVDTALASNKKWLYDVILDAKADLIREPITNKVFANGNYTLLKSLENINNILSIILNKDVKLKTNYRNDTYARISIVDAKNNEIIIPSLDHLSTGQNILLNIFLTIIKYSDKDDVNKSINLNQINGIVIIDEIDSHLHPFMQRVTLPKLMKLFPGIQFIATAHSPLFLLGIENEYTDTGFKIIELPNGNKIDAEHYSEFKISLNYFRDTIEFEKVIKSLVNNSKKPIIITEGKSDSLILKTAWEKLYPNNDITFECIPSGLQIDESKREGNADSVRRTLEFISNISDELIIGIFDNDREGNEQFKSLSNKCFEPFDLKKYIRKHLTKNIYGILLPITTERQNFIDSDDIKYRFFEIEHYFSDDILLKHNKIGKKILNSDVFEIIGNKYKFAEEVKNFDKNEFNNFSTLFNFINQIIQSK